MEKSKIKSVFPLYYLPDISYFHFWKNDSDAILIEKEEFFIKQTDRTRTQIVGPNGMQRLVVPTLHNRNELKTKYKDTKISYAENWHLQHCKSIENNYRKSPYFEYYYDDIRDIYSQKNENIFDFNLQFLQLVLKILNLKKKIIFTQEYLPSENYQIDFRKNIPKYNTKEYMQVYSYKQKFIKNVSVLDIIFCLGLESSLYL